MTICCPALVSFNVERERDWSLLDPFLVYMDPQISWLFGQYNWLLGRNLLYQRHNYRKRDVQKLSEIY